MTEKHTDSSSYKHSHQKNAKREVKRLTRSSVPDTIFSNKQQATSNKQQATKRHKGFLCPSKLEYTQISSTNNTHRTGALSLCVFYITPFKKTAKNAENAKDYKRMSYKASLKPFCEVELCSTLCVLRG